MLSNDPIAYRIDDVDVTGAAFLVPLDAPVPSELGETETSQGSLYERLAPVAIPDGEGFALVPISGAELLSLDQAWTRLQGRKKVFALFDLPGARYDVMFVQAVRQIGIRRIEWSIAATALAERSRILQRTGDTTPWVLKPDASAAAAPSSSAEATTPSAAKKPGFKTQRMGSGIVVGQPEEIDEDRAI